MDTRTYTCDVCAASQQLQATLLGCRVCDYDICMSCAKLHADLKARALEEAEQQLREEEETVRKNVFVFFACKENLSVHRT